MTDQPATTYIVSVFDKPNWRTVLTHQGQGRWEFRFKMNQNSALAGDHAESRKGPKR